MPVEYFIPFKIDLGDTLGLITAVIGFFAALLALAAVSSWKTQERYRQALVSEKWMVDTFSDLVLLAYEIADDSNRNIDVEYFIPAGEGNAPYWLRVLEAKFNKMPDFDKKVQLFYYHQDVLTQGVYFKFVNYLEYLQSIKLKVEHHRKGIMKSDPDEFEPNNFYYLVEKSGEIEMALSSFKELTFTTRKMPYSKKLKIKFFDFLRAFKKTPDPFKDL